MSKGQKGGGRGGGGSRGSSVPPPVSSGRLQPATGPGDRGASAGTFHEPAQDLCRSVRHVVSSAIPVLFSLFMICGLFIQLAHGTHLGCCVHAFKRFSVKHEDLVSNTRISSTVYQSSNRYGFGDPAEVGCRVDVFGARIMFRRGTSVGCKRFRKLCNSVDVYFERGADPSARRDRKHYRAYESGVAKFVFHDFLPYVNWENLVLLAKVLPYVLVYMFLSILFIIPMIVKLSQIRFLLQIICFEPF